MNEQTTLTPAKAAELVGVEVYTIRRWCDWHAAHLSPGASPGAGALRRLTMRDVEVLKTVRDLRAQGLTTTTINEQLAGLTFPEIEEPDALDALPASPEGLHSPQLPVRALDDHETRLGRLERSLVEVQGAARPNWWWWVFGVVCGLAMAGLAELFALVARR